MPVRSVRRKRSTGKEDELVTRSVVFALEYTTVFRGAPPVVGPAALLLGNIDNDPKGEVEVAVGGVDGRLVIFKGGSSTSAPFLVASGIGCVVTSRTVRPCQMPKLHHQLISEW